MCGVEAQGRTKGWAEMGARHDEKPQETAKEFETCSDEDFIPPLGKEVIDHLKLRPLAEREGGAA